jgi:hypothetical protein
MIAFAIIASLLPCATDPLRQSTDACGVFLPQFVRVNDCRLAAAVSGGIGRSPTLHELVERIGKLNGVVYVFTTSPVVTPGGFAAEGALSHDVNVTGSTRLLRVTVRRRRDYADDSVATVAHELRHALEILEDPSVRSTAAVDALFTRIGDGSFKDVRETTEARNVEQAVQRELKARKERPSVLRTVSTPCVAEMTVKR